LLDVARFVHGGDGHATRWADKQVNIFECGTIVCIPVGIGFGAYYGSGYGITGGVLGALIGAVAAVFAGPLLGLAILFCAHIECVMSGDAPMFGKYWRKKDKPSEDDTGA
jgi:hypothetical protein